MNLYLPGFEPDAAERAQLRFINGTLDLRQFDKILISVSGDCEVVGNREVSIVYDEEMDEYSECEVIEKIEDVKLSCSHSKHRIFVLC